MQKEMNTTIWHVRIIILAANLKVWIVMALSGTDGIGPVIFGGNEGIIEYLKGKQNM